MDLATPSGVREWATTRLGYTVETVERLSGGLVNYVWRVRTAGDSVIVKHARDGLAVNPAVKLSRDRLRFEFEALRQFAGAPAIDLGEFFSLPEALSFDEERSVLAMEDMGRFGGPNNNHGGVIGEFIGFLHGSTRDSATLQKKFNNADVQRVRLETQYRQVGQWLHDAGSGNAQRCGEIASTFGSSLMDDGDCVVMGDLWPPAILGAPDSRNCTLIDWEFVHYGRPAQDVGHLAAHLLMHWHGAKAPFLAGPIGWSGEVVWSEFKRGYRRYSDEWCGELERELAVHAGCEILTRTIGPLASSYSEWFDDDDIRMVRYAERLILGDVEFGQELDAVFNRSAF